MSLNDILMGKSAPPLQTNYAPTSAQTSAKTQKSLPGGKFNNLKAAIGNVQAAREEYERKQREEGDDENITLKYIIREKPKTKIVREFFRANLDAIPSAEELLFT